ncbi:MAG TPA: gliding motility-associated C-terminal domain-containing protein [Bacteroidia bacterium]|nr:gliding motility-associated C-terminal domain-containing protein [Bacteroidia bacterium]
MLKRIIIPILLGCLFYTKATASHLMGGEITWACQGNGSYIFTVKLYRDCNGSAGEDSITVYVFNNPALDSIRLSIFAKKDISPTCNPSGPVISCQAAESDPNWPDSKKPIAGAVQEAIFRSKPIFLSGVPPAQGWIFTYDECCRNQSISNLVTPSQYGFTLRAIMYPFNGRNAGPCFDSSPTFLESPSSVICLGYPFTYNHNASDADLDSLSYSWDAPYGDFSGKYDPPNNPFPVKFASGYSYKSPLPGTQQDSRNVPATINSATGEISFTSYTLGYFVTVVKVEAWKCNQKVAEIYREMQIVLLPCSVNEKPIVTFTTHKDTVQAGELVTFTIHGNDKGFLANGTTPQTLTITATGTQLGTTSTTGCLNPPCATLSPAAPVSGQTDVETTFSWQTTCDHVAANAGCNPHPNTYTFVFKTQDDFCPAPAQNISTISITVLANKIVPSPQPRCVTVLPNGDVTLTWSPVTNVEKTFNSYHIFSSKSPTGPFTIVDSIFSLTQNSYTHIGANANTSPTYYLIKTRSGCGGKVFSDAIDTIASMNLKVLNPSNGTAQLSWNTIANPLFPSSTGLYKVYMEYPAGNWQLKKQTTSTSCIDSITICNANLNYRVEMQDTTGCISVSSIAGGTFKNIIAPVTPSLDTISVDDNNKIIIGWAKSPSTDVKAYLIYKKQGGANVLIDTVRDSTFYYYLKSTPDQLSESYLIAALDSCGNIGLLGTPLSSMYLKATADICDRSAILTWTAYNTIGTGLEEYRIFQSTTGNTGPYTYVGAVPAGTLTYRVPGLSPNTTYYFKVQAIDFSHTKTASANRMKFLSVVPTPPKYSYMRRVSVDAPNAVSVTCHIDVQASSKAYKITRSETNAPGSFEDIGTVAATKNTPISFTDVTAATGSKSYYYKMVDVDSCGFDGLETNIGRTILLTAVSNNEQFTNNLSWNDYEIWSGTVVSYNIYRGIDGVIDPAPIANVPYTGGLNTYADDISNLLTGQGVFSYYVEALEGTGNIYGFAENSISNVAEAYQDPLIYIPNAFVPTNQGGSNEIFIPVTTFVDFKEYEFLIFNRWGAQIFETKEVGKGWDGKFDGKNVEPGVYVYVLRYKTSRGEYLNYKGSVTLIR